MGSTIVKIAPDVDQYVVWSSITDSPHMWGTRDETIEYLMEVDEKKPEYAKPEIEHRMWRADDTGTSSFISGGWDSAGFVVMNTGWLPRSRLQAFLDSFDPTTETFDLSLLDPFED